MRSIGWLLLLGVVVTAGYLLLAAVVIGTGVGISPYLLLVSIPAAIALALWAFPRLIMFETAVAVGAKGTSPFSAVSQVVRGRFSAVFGRALLAIIGGGIASYAVQTVASFALLPMFLTAADNSELEFESIPQDFGTSATLITRDGVPATSVELADFLPTGSFVTFLIVGGLLYMLSSALSHVVLGAGTTHMYADVQAPADESGAITAQSGASV